MAGRTTNGISFRTVLSPTHPGSCPSEKEVMLSSADCHSLEREQKSFSPLVCELANNWKRCKVKRTPNKSPPVCASLAPFWRRICRREPFPWILLLFLPLHLQLRQSMAIAFGNWQAIKISAGQEALVKLPHRVYMAQYTEGKYLPTLKDK